MNAKTSGWGLSDKHSGLARQGRDEQADEQFRILYYIRVYVFATEFQGAGTAANQMSAGY